MEQAHRSRAVWCAAWVGVGAFCGIKIELKAKIKKILKKDMKYILTEDTLAVPEGVTITSKSKNVEVKGRRIMGRKYDYSRTFGSPEEEFQACQR